MGIWNIVYINRSVSLVAPAVRTVLVEVAIWQEDDGTFQEHEDHRFIPVLAIRNTVRDAYQCMGDRKRLSPNHREMISNGWHYDGEDQIFDFLIIDSIDGNCDLIDSTTAYENCCNCMFEPVACTWPPEQDVTMLAPIVAKLTIKVRSAIAEALAREKAREKKASAGET